MQVILPGRRQSRGQHAASFAVARLGRRWCAGLAKETVENIVGRGNGRHCNPCVPRAAVAMHARAEQRKEEERPRPTAVQNGHDKNDTGCQRPRVSGPEWADVAAEEDEGWKLR